jgi:hypothetical protein
MAQAISLDIAFEYLVSPVEWTLEPAPDQDIWGRRVDQDDWFIPSLGRGSARRADAWEARDEFFHLRSGDSGKLLDFLNRWGSWLPFESTFEDVAVNGVAAKDVWQVRERFLKGVMNPLVEWLTDSSVNESPLAIFQPRLKYPHFFYRATGSAIAMHTTITLDMLRRTKFRLCARKDCPVPFPVRSKKKYCGWYCGHIESVRKNRRAEKRAKRMAEKEASAETKKSAQERRRANG